jgi:ribosomal protein S19E (S16A)
LCFLRGAQLEDVDVVAKSTHVKGGRTITPNGQRDLDLIAGRIERPAEEEEEDEEGLEE